jgi:hypothetical protein
VNFFKGNAGLEFDFIVCIYIYLFIYNNSGRLKDRTKWNVNFHAPCSFAEFLIESVTLRVKLNIKAPFLSCASFGTSYRV